MSSHMTILVEGDSSSMESESESDGMIISQPALSRKDEQHSDSEDDVEVIYTSPKKISPLRQTLQSKQSPRTRSTSKVPANNPDVDSDSEAERDTPRKTQPKKLKSKHGYQSPRSVFKPSASVGDDSDSEPEPLDLHQQHDLSLRRFQSNGTDSTGDEQDKPSASNGSTNDNGNGKLEVSNLPKSKRSLSKQAIRSHPHERTTSPTTTTTTNNNNNNISTTATTNNNNDNTDHRETSTSTNTRTNTHTSTNSNTSANMNTNTNANANTNTTSPTVYLTPPPPPHPQPSVIDIHQFMRERLTDPSGVEYANKLIQVMAHDKLMTVREIAKKTNISAVHFVKLKNTLAPQDTSLHFVKLIEGTKTECTDWAFAALTHLSVTKRKRLQSLPGKNGEPTKWFMTNIKSHSGAKLFDPRTNVPQAKAQSNEDQAGEDVHQQKNKPKIFEQQHCEFCQMKGEPRGCGPILGPFVTGVHQKHMGSKRKKLIYVHKYCAEYSIKVFHEKDPEDTQQPILNAESVTTACAHAKNVKCCICNRFGANIVCGAGVDKCNRMFHLPCAVQRNYDLHEFKVFCVECEKPNMATSIVKVLNSPQKPTMQESQKRNHDKKKGHICRQ